jgi:ATP-binding protein involved in chromosome partitioning
LIDPRTSIISKRLSRINRIIAVSSGKGGVGKSMVATTLALTLVRNGCDVGLFDLDFTSPSTHIILGANLRRAKPKEEKGIVPPIISSLHYMSIVYFVGEKPAPLRGAETSNALIELLTITRWGKLDFLIIDMPPGIGDAVLDLVRLIRNIEFLIVTTPSTLAFETVKKQANLLCALKMPIIGILENMKMDTGNYIQMETEKLGLRYLGEIPYDQQVEATIGDQPKLLATALGKQMRQVAKIVALTKKSEE